MAAEASSSRADAEVVVEQPEMTLYQACLVTGNFEKLWFQDDLQALEQMDSKDIHALLKCIQKLVDQCLFKSMEAKDGRQCWRVVPQDQASNIRKLNQEERMVYFELENAGIEGVWSKNIKQRTHLQVAEITQALKKLESKGFVKQFSSAKYPNKKLYILSHLQPSEEAAGGLFYSDGKVDTVLLGIVMQYTEVYVHRKAWQARDLTSSSDKNGKRKRDDNEHPTDPAILSGSKRWKGVKPMPAGYPGYATIGEVAKYLNKSRVLKDKIMESEAEQVLNLLCYDGRLEKVGESDSYRTVLKPIANSYRTEREAARNGFSEVPCGGCPALDLCDESGPVNARSCEYFKEWL